MCYGYDLVYSIKDRDSFKGIKSRWMKDIRANDGEYNVILLGNKSDLQGQRKVKNKDGQKLAKELEFDFNSVQFFEISAETGDGFENALYGFFKCKSA